LNLSENLRQYSKFRKNAQNFAKNLIKKVDKNENIGEHSICNFSTNFSGAQKIAQERGEI